MKINWFFKGLPSFWGPLPYPIPPTLDESLVYQVVGNFWKSLFKVLLSLGSGSPVIKPTVTPCDNKSQKVSCVILICIALLTDVTMLFFNVNTCAWYMQLVTILLVLPVLCQKDMAGVGAAGMFPRGGAGSQRPHSGSSLESLEENLRQTIQGKGRCDCRLSNSLLLKDPMLPPPPPNYILTSKNLNKCLRTHFLPDSILGPRDIAGNKAKFLFLWSSYLAGEIGTKEADM